MREYNEVYKDGELVSRTEVDVPDPEPSDGERLDALLDAIDGATSLNDLKQRARKLKKPNPH